MLSSSTVLDAVAPLAGRDVAASYWVGQRQTVGMDGVLRDASVRLSTDGRKVVRLDFADVGWLDVPVEELIEVRAPGEGAAVELDLGGGDFLELHDDDEQAPGEA